MSGLVIDHLWQSSLFAVLAGLLTLAFRKNGAGIRFGLWFAASMKFLLPFSLLVSLGRYLQWEPVQPSPMSEQWSGVLEQIAQPASFIAAAGTAAAQPGLAIPMIAAEPPTPRFDLVLLLGIVWAVGFVALLLLWMVRWFRVRAILKKSSLSPLGAPIPVMSTPAVLEPALFGVFNPVLLWPEGINAHLTDDQIDAILAHEVCHWRRRDNIWAMVHMAVEAVFWFHPLVWWLGQQLVVEREKACDEDVIGAGQARQSYAESILKVCQFCMEQKLLCVAAVSGGNLKKRIEIIMTLAMPAKLHRAKKLLLISAAIVALAGPVLVGCTVAPGSFAPNVPLTKPGEDPNLGYQRMIDQRRYEQSKPRTEVQIDAKLLDGYVGYYRLWNRIYTVTRNDKHLLVQLSGEVNQMAPDEIFPEGERDFFFKGRAAQMSFYAEGKEPAKKLALHEAGYDQIFQRVSEAEAQGIREYLSRRIKENMPTPGVEAVLKRHYESLANGTPDYEDLGENTTKNTREQQGFTARGAGTYGALQSITFLGVDSNGWDMYRITYAARELENSVVFRLDGKIDGVHGIPDRSVLRKEVAIASQNIDAYVGNYLQSNTLIMTVTRDGNRLFLKGTNQAPFEIFAENDHDFFTKTNLMRFTFQGEGSAKRPSLVLHTNNRDYPAIRISDTEAQTAEAFLAQRIKQNTAIAGSQDALHRFITDTQKGQLAYETLDPVLAGIMRNTISGFQRQLNELGELQSLTFKGVSQTGADIYAAHYIRGDQEYQIIATDGIIRLLNVRLIS